MSDLLLDARSKIRLSDALRGINSIEGIPPDRLRQFKFAATDHIELAELERISNALFPMPLSNIIMDTEYRVREIANAND